ncbi:hypothetical protein B0H14DRAFT_2589926 [Mycena olivaceomarginata]|nr:hypothetical protein B0H14DRAFT_2589926 [Mycena olivaceomarginata]
MLKSASLPMLRLSAGATTLMLRNLNDTRAKARLRMQRLRARHTLSEEDKKLAAEHRQGVDADYRELRRKKNFIDMYGLSAYINIYVPLHTIYGPYIETGCRVRRKNYSTHQHLQTNLPALRMPNCPFIEISFVDSDERGESERPCIALVMQHQAVHAMRSGKVEAIQ